MLILEDLDSLINNMNRAFFLNEVDGLEDNDGLLMVRTWHFLRTPIRLLIIRLVRPITLTGLIRHYPTARPVSIASSERVY